MRPILQPGIRAPKFTAIAANRPEGIPINDGAPHHTVILFFPGNALDQQMEELTKFQSRVSDFEALNASVVGVSDASADALVAAAKAYGVEFALVSDPDRLISGGYGTASGDAVVPTAFIVDAEGEISRVYEHGTTLPNAASVLRAVRGLASISKPAPVAENDWCYGPRSAPVILFEYSDYQCVHCRQAHEVLNDILARYRTQVALVHRHYPLKHSHPFAQLAAEAAEAAGAQGKFWEMHHALFTHSPELSDECIRMCADQIGLDTQAFARDLESHRFESAVNAAAARARAEKIKFPPVLFINRIQFEGPRTADAIGARIDSLLACVGAK